MSTSPKRPRGGQPGNLNALKHGFYMRRLDQQDLSGVESTDAKNLIDEIALVRVFTRRLVEALDPEADVNQIASALRILCLSLTAITRAMKTQHMITPPNGNFTEELRIAIEQANAYLRSKKPQLSSVPSITAQGPVPPPVAPDAPPPPTS